MPEPEPEREPTQEEIEAACREIQPVLDAINGVTTIVREMRDSFRAIAADIEAQPIEVMTLAKLRAMEEGQGEYFGEPYIIAARTHLNEVRAAWPCIKDTNQRRTIQNNIRKVMDEIAARRYKRLGPEWQRFREECMELVQDWNVVAMLGDVT